MVNSNTNSNITVSVRYGVSTAVKMHILADWGMTVCSLVGGYYTFGGKFCDHLLRKK